MQFTTSHTRLVNAGHCVLPWVIAPMISSTQGISWAPSIPLWVQGLCVLSRQSAQVSFVFSLSEGTLAFTAQYPVSWTWLLHVLSGSFALFVLADSGGRVHLALVTAPWLDLEVPQGSTPNSHLTFWEEKFQKCLEQPLCKMKQDCGWVCLFNIFHKHYKRE